VPLVTALAVAVGLAAALVAWKGTVAGRPQGVVTTFSVLSDQEVQATVEVNSGGRDATCMVAAKGRDGAEVGRSEVSVRAEPGRGTYSIRTSARAVAVEIESCR
jgi:hypothetical protein